MPEAIVVRNTQSHGCAVDPHPLGLMHDHDALLYKNYTPITPVLIRKNAHERDEKTLKSQLQIADLCLWALCPPFVFFVINSRFKTKNTKGRHKARKETLNGLTSS